jgi:hypothetical protein
LIARKYNGAKNGKITSNLSGIPNDRKPIMRYITVITGESLTSEVSEAFILINDLFHLDFGIMNRIALKIRSSVPTVHIASTKPITPLAT